MIWIKVYQLIQGSSLKVVPKIEKLYFKMFEQYDLTWIIVPLKCFLLEIVC